jgi:voltage-gated potassium channel
MKNGFRSATRRQELVFYGAVVLGVLLCGTLGYTIIEGWHPFDAFYMTVITLATIGYGETHPLTTGGRVFTILLIFVGVGLGTVVLGAVGRTIIEGQLLRVFDRSKRMREQLEVVKDHYIFCGFSRLSRMAINELRSTDVPLVVIEADETRAREAEQQGILVVHGNATVDESLVQAGIARATKLITLLPRDSDNLYVILTARELNPSLYIVSRAEDELGEKRLKRAGVDKLISAYRLAARKLTDGLLRPYVTDFFEIATAGKDGYKIEQITVGRDSPVCGKNLGELSLRQRANVGIAAVVSPDGKLELAPSGDTVLDAESTLIAIGLKTDIAVLEGIVLNG